MTDQLKPCPFCGGKAEICEGSKYGHYLACMDCDASLGTLFGAFGVVNGSFGGAGDVFSAWNTRADPWQPIETAPKDVELLLGWRGFGQKWETCTDFAHCSRGGWHHGSATHWRPIPNPPA